MCNFCFRKSSKVTFSLHEQFDLLTWDYAGETHFSMIYISLMLQNLGAFQFWANISITFIFLKRWLFRIGIFHGWHHSDKLLCSFWVISMGINSSVYIYIFFFTTAKCLLNVLLWRNKFITWIFQNLTCWGIKSFNLFKFTIWKTLLLSRLCVLVCVCTCKQYQEKKRLIEGADPL